MNNNYYVDQNAGSDERLLSDISRFLRYERIAWKVSGIVFLVCTVMFFVGSILMIAGGIIYADQPYYDYVPVMPAFGFIGAGMVYLIAGLICYLPLSIIGFTMVKKVSYYQDTLYTDVSIARARCGSVGMIVFGAIFNTIAMAFIIVNFVKVKNEAQALDRIEAMQRGAYNG